MIRRHHLEEASLEPIGYDGFGAPIYAHQVGEDGE